MINSLNGNSWIGFRDSDSNYGELSYLINIVNNKTDAILSSSDNQCLLEELPDLIEKLEIKMKDAAKELNFEEAANLRDRIKKLRQKLARND